MWGAAFGTEQIQCKMTSALSGSLSHWSPCFPWTSQWWQVTPKTECRSLEVASGAAYLRASPQNSFPSFLVILSVYINTGLQLFKIFYQINLACSHSGFSKHNFCSVIKFTSKSSTICKLHQPIIKTRNALADVFTCDWKVRCTSNHFIKKGNKWFSLEPWQVILKMHLFSEHVHEEILVGISEFFLEEKKEKLIEQVLHITKKPCFITCSQVLGKRQHLRTGACGPSPWKREGECQGTGVRE